MLSKQGQGKNNQMFVVKKSFYLHKNAPLYTEKPVRALWKHSTLGTHQTWLLPISICFYRWVTHLLSSVLVRTILDGWFAAKGNIFTGMVFIIAREMVKMYNEYILNKALFIILPNLTCFFSIRLSNFYSW